jgi:NADPH:quinone reductase-like Zn-dependent oxidoreductase
MKAVCYYGQEDIRVKTVPDPAILNPRDAIVRVTATAICGSDLHIYGGYIPTMRKGDVLGHEFMGEVVEVGRDNTRLRVGDRVVVPFTIACGRCYFCKEAAHVSDVPREAGPLHQSRDEARRWRAALSAGRTAPQDDGAGAGKKKTGSYVTWSRHSFRSTAPAC